VRIVEAVTVVQDLDPYLSLRGLAGYSGLSVRLLRSMLRHPVCPLPHYRVGVQGGRVGLVAGGNGRGSKVLVRRSEFDRWMATWRQAPPGDVGAALDAIFASSGTSSGREKTGHLLGNGKRRKGDKGLGARRDGGCSQVAG
jgi:hypothetical protein